MINPVLIGAINTSEISNSGLDAVTKIWGRISEHTLKTTPLIIVTLQNKSNGKLHHYKINEIVNLADKSQVVSNITEENYNIEESRINKLLSINKKFDRKLKLHEKQAGGKKKKKIIIVEDSSSSSSSSSSDDDFRKLIKIKSKKPVSYIWYTPYLYDQNQKVYIPAFTQPNAPYICTQYI